MTNDPTIAASIERKIRALLSPIHLEVVNESSRHHRDPKGESHFQVVVVSIQFDGKGRMERQRLVQDLFAEERAKGLHALTLRTLTPDEFAKSGGVVKIDSPACQGSD